VDFDVHGTKLNIRSVPRGDEGDLSEASASNSALRLTSWHATAVAAVEAAIEREMRVAEFTTAAAIVATGTIPPSIQAWIRTEIHAKEM